MVKSDKDGLYISVAFKQEESIKMGVVKWDQHSQHCNGVEIVMVWMFLPWLLSWKSASSSAENQWGRTKVVSEDHRPSWQENEGQSPAQTQHRKRLCMSAAPFSWRRTLNPSVVPGVQTEELSAGLWDELVGRNLTSNKVVSWHRTEEMAINILGLALVSSRWRIWCCKIRVIPGQSCFWPQLKPQRSPAGVCSGTSRCPGFNQKGAG